MDIEALINRTVTLPSLPEVVMRTYELMRDPLADSSDIGVVIGEDAALTLRLLKIVNSPYYGFPSRVNTLSRAITIIGTVELLDLVLATTVVKLFAGIPKGVINMEQFWQHSLYCGVLAKVIAQKKGIKNAEHYFVGGLLHDIGRLVMLQNSADAQYEAIGLANQSGIALTEAEVKIYGFSHAEVGGALARKWKLPHSLEIAMEFHHAPMNAKEHQDQALITCLANNLAARGLESVTEEAPDSRDSSNDQYWNLLRIDPTQQQPILEQAKQLFDEAKSFIGN